MGFARPGRSFARICLAAIALLSMGSQCGKTPKINILSPAHGDFSTAASVIVSGEIKNINIPNAEVRVNGVVVPVAGDGTWSQSVTLDAVEIVTPVVAELFRVSTGERVASRRIVVLASDSVVDGDFSLESVALRLTDDGLDQVEPLIQSMVNLDVASLLPVGTQVINDFCAIDGGFLGCLGSVDVFVANPPATISGFDLGIDSQTDFVDGDIDIFDVRVDLDINGSGLAPSCGLRITANQTDIDGDYFLVPDGVDPTSIDVNLNGSPSVGFTGFDQEFTIGLCDFPLIGSLVQLIIGNVQPIVLSGLQNFLSDPDGAGPLDSPIADAIEVALADISIAGPIGEGLAVSLEAPLFDVVEDTNGITLASDTRIQSVVGTGPGECTPPANAPELTASYHVDEVFPSFGATTPVSALPYDLGLCISTSAFNQLLKSQVECGLLQTSITELDFGTGPIPVTAGSLALFVPEFSQFDPNMLLRIDLTPTLAAFITGNLGPASELAEIRMPHYAIDVIIDNGTEEKLLGGAIDFRAGLDLTFDDLTGSLVASIGSVVSQDITVAILENPVGTNEATLGVVLPVVLALVLPDLGAGIGEFPLPEFLGLQLQGVEVSRNGEFLSLFADLTPVP